MFLTGHSYREVARLLEQPEGTTKSRIRNGLGRLRAQLSDDDDDRPRQELPAPAGS